MKTKRTIRTAAFAASLAAWCGWGDTTAYAQVDAWAIGTQAVVMPPGTNGAAGQPFNLPTPGNTNLPATWQYQGQAAQRSQHARTTGDGRLLFFEVDGNLYDGDVYLIADARGPNCTECLEPGVMEFVSVPVPGSCNLFYLFSAVASGNVPGYDRTHLQWSILNMDADNTRFPAQAPTTCARKGRLLSNELDLGSPPYSQHGQWMNTNDFVREPNAPFMSQSSNFAGALLPVSNDANTAAPRIRVVESANASGDHWLFFISNMRTYLYRVTATGIYTVNPIPGESRVRMKQSPSAGATDYYYDADASLTSLPGQPDDVLALAIVDRGGLYAYPNTQNSANNLIVLYFNRNTGALIPSASQAHNLFTLPANCTGITVPLPNGGYVRPVLRGCAFSSNGQGLYLTGERSIDCLSITPYAAHLNLQNSTITDISFAFGQNFDPQWTRSRIYRNTAPSGTGEAVYIPGLPDVGVLLGLENLGAVTFSSSALGAVTPPELYNGTRPADCGYVPRFLDIGIAHDRYLSPQNRGTCCAFLQKHGSGIVYGHEQAPGMTPTSWTATSNPYGNASPLTCVCDIVVKPGASLYPSNLTIKFADDAKLVVERGGNVIATNSTLTSLTCPSERWPGIRVEGTTASGNQALSAVINGQLTYLQGNLRLTNSTVENAVLGAWTAREAANGTAVPGYAGGRIYGYNSTFKNCISGVRIDPYTRTSSTGAVLDNLSGFHYCSFITDAAWPDPGLNNPLHHARLQSVKGIKFNQCKLRNDAPGQFPLLNRGWGIMGAAGFDVLGNTTADASLFRGLTVGVYANTGTTRKANVRQSWFRDNFVGAYFLGSTAPELSRSHFYVPDGSWPNSPIGLLLQGSTGYIVEENSFNANNILGANIGIYWKGDVLAENRIYNNTFTGLNAGTYVQNRHKGNTPATEYLGLKLYCSDYTDCGLDYYLGDHTYIKAAQGYWNGIPAQSQLAGNRFTNGVLNGISINSNQVDDANAPFFNYFRHNVPVCNPQNPVFYPSDYYSDIVIANANNFVKAEACGGGLLPTLNGGGGVVGYGLAAAQLQSAQAYFTGTVDTGEREDILEAIKRYDPWLPSHTLRDYLLARCPLSDEVLLTVIYREQAMDAWHLTQVMLANAKLTEQVLKALERSGLLNEYMLALVRNAGSGLTVKDLLRQEVELRAGQKAGYFAVAMEEWATDSITPDPDDSLRVMLASHADASDYYLLATFDLERGNNGSAHAWLDALVQAKAEEATILRDLVEMHEVLNGDWTNADGAQRAALATMAQSAEPGAAAAQAILYSLNESDELPTAEEPSTAKSLRLRSLSNAGSTARPVLEVHPNPSNGRSWAAISVEIEGNAVLYVSDPQGRLVSTVGLAAGQRLVELDLSGLAGGLYTCELLQGDHKLAAAKLTVQH